MGKFFESWRIQRRVIVALMIREFSTRFGREHIGFLWIMVEPLMFALLVALVWRTMKGSEEHGVSIVMFVISGYITLTLFCHCVSRSVKVFEVNSSLLYHRKISLSDFILVRFIIEMIGTHAGVRIRRHSPLYLWTVYADLFNAGAAGGLVSLLFFHPIHLLHYCSTLRSFGHS